MSFQNAEVERLLSYGIYRRASLFPSLESHRCEAPVYSTLVYRQKDLEEPLVWFLAVLRAKFRVFAQKYLCVGSRHNSELVSCWPVAYS